MTTSIADVIQAHIDKDETALPVFDGTSQRLQGMMSDSEFDMDEVEKLIASDPVLSAALLRVANSTFYAGLEKVTTPRQALTRLGAKQVSSVVTLVGQKKNYQVKAKSLAPLVTRLWQHSVACAVGSQWLCQRIKRNDLAGEAFQAGLLHDIGKLFVLRVIDEMMAGDASFEPPESLVLELLDQMHTDQGSKLLSQWNLPEQYIELVRDHHAPDFEDSDVLLIVVRIVDLACKRVGVSLVPDESVQLASSAEAEVLRLSDVVVAELEIAIEDALEVAAEA